MDITLWDKATTTFPEDDILTADQDGHVILAFLSMKVKKFNGIICIHTYLYIYIHYFALI